MIGVRESIASSGSPDHPKRPVFEDRVVEGNNPIGESHARSFQTQKLNMQRGVGGEDDGVGDLIPRENGLPERLVHGLEIDNWHEKIRPRRVDSADQPRAAVVEPVKQKKNKTKED